MKKRFILCLFLLTTTAQAGELHDFNQVKSTLQIGKTIHFVFDLSKCDGGTYSNIEGTFTPNEVIVDSYYNKIHASNLHFTLNHPNFINKPVYEYTTYLLDKYYNSSYVIVTTQVLDVKKSSVLKSESKWYCRIGNGIKIYD